MSSSRLLTMHCTGNVKDCNIALIVYGNPSYHFLGLTTHFVFPSPCRRVPYWLQLRLPFFVSGVRTSYGPTKTGMWP